MLVTSCMDEVVGLADWLVHLQNPCESAHVGILLPFSDRTQGQEALMENLGSQAQLQNVRHVRIPDIGHTPSAAGTCRRRFRKNPGKTPETLSELFLEFPWRVRLGSPKPYNSRHFKPPEHFQNSPPPPPRAAGDASFFRNGSGEGLSELVMEFPAVLRGFLKIVPNLRSNIVSSTAGVCLSDCQ